MKTTSDNKEVPDRCWYYLLDWNDIKGKEIMLDKFSKERLMDLTEKEFWELFEISTNTDLKKIIVTRIQSDSLIETCGGCPMVWEGKTSDDKPIYIMLRWGHLRVESDDVSLFSGNPDHDGVMGKSEMIEFVTKESQGKIIFI